MKFRPRRRRKRPRSASTNGESKSKHQTNLSASENVQRTTQTNPIEDQIRSNSTTKVENNVSRSVLLLLYRRESGGLGRRIDSPLISSCLATKSKRQIRFSQLQSSNTEAVLALEQSGSYFFSLAGGDSSFALALRLYGVPSQSRLDKSIGGNATQHTLCPLVTTIPLLLPSYDDSHDDLSPVASLRVQVVVSPDWSVGMAFVRHSSREANDTTNNDEDALSDLIMFSLSSPGIIIQSFRCLNVRAVGSEAFTMRNLLWETNAIPCGDSTSTALCSEVLNLPGYLFLNDEEDGFRLAWVLSSSWNTVKAKCVVGPVTPSRLARTPARHDIITRSDEVVWEEHWSERYSGRMVSTWSDCEILNIAFEASFRIDALLHDILARRKEKFGYQENHALPEFHYNLISINGDGRTASLVIAFERTERSAAGTRRSAVAVFLDFDLFTSLYEETKWVQNLATPTPSTLRDWSNVLALNRRMKDQVVGPFCSALGAKCDTIDWSEFYDDTNNSYDTTHDKNVNLWNRYLQMSGGGVPSLFYSQDAPKTVSCLSLFPNCDLITNDAVRSGMPVPFIRCRDLTTEFVYG